MDWPNAEQLLANAIQFLLQGDERDAALLLLSCEASYGDDPGNGFSMLLLGPRAVYEGLKYVAAENWRASEYDDELEAEQEWRRHNMLHDQVYDAFTAVAPPGAVFKGFQVSVSFPLVQPGWRVELEDVVKGQRVHNQGVEIPGSPPLIPWLNLRFRSQAEVYIAKALEAEGVLFLPNCLARLGKVNARTTKEADFLVCKDGHWGVLEVDSDFHPRASTDHERDRLFQQHGIKVTQRYDWQKCRNDAAAVVREFLALLEKNG